MTEQKIQKRILRFLKDIGAYPAKIVTGNRAGIPDILACVNGRFVAIEVKVPGKEATKLQDLHLQRIKEAGGVAFVAHGADEVREALMKAGLI
ncbi:VRR-NUC domain-containing protein [Nitratifractor salsuginis]|uniref:VRR-NUC domain-containing protein n=1 Tax=Nitratifractor salsuginis (strain DSM 16511 / JCM 12458 / E9I37-1) TaxID=749222 RepID=E6WZ42_NITSE|nr:VRR-NUC domain-containing protein [Nitratifractor salsuginis]ADV45492.1 VRR-NUC domain-containing protein [Nitratifractor salsuginis DSM 16511]